MPLTPFHWGPGLLFGLLLLRWIDFPAFMVASVVVDVEPIIIYPVMILVFRVDYPLHGFFHSFLGGTLVALLTAAVMSRIRRTFSPLLAFFKIEQKSSFKNILLASLAGVYGHILLDSRTHWDIRPFYPLDINPLLNRSMLAWLELDMLCMWSFIGGVFIYAIRLFLIWRKNR